MAANPPGRASGDNESALVGSGVAAHGLATVAAMVGGFLTTVLAVRLLGRTDYGALAYGLAIVTLVTASTRVGLGGAVVRTIASLEADPDTGQKLPAILRSVLTLVLTTSLIGSAVVLFLIPLTRHDLEVDQRWLAAGGLALLLLGRSIGGAVTSVFRGLGRMVRSEIPVLAGVALQLLALTLVGSLGLAELGSVSVGFGLAGIAVAVISVVLMRGWVGSGGDWRLDPAGAVHFLVAAAPFAIAGIAWQVLAQLDVIVLGLARSGAEVGTYEPALRVTDRLLLLIPSLFLTGFIPGATRLATTGALAQFRDFYVRASKVTFVLSFPLIVGLVLYPYTVVQTLFGDDFPVSPSIVWILASGYTVNLAFGLNTGALVAIGNRRTLARTFGVVLAATVLLAFVLIPIFGQVGAAIATSLSYVTMNALVGWAVFRGSGAHPFRRDMVLILTTSSVFVGAGFFIRQVAGDGIGSGLGVTLVLWASWIGCLLVIRALRVEELARFIPRGGLREPPR